MLRVNIYFVNCLRFMMWVIEILICYIEYIILLVLEVFFFCFLILEDILICLFVWIWKEEIVLGIFFYL